MINSYGKSSKCIIHVRHFTIFDRANIKPHTLSQIFFYFAVLFYKFHIYLLLIVCETQILQITTLNNTPNENIYHKS